MNNRGLKGGSGGHQLLSWRAGGLSVDTSCATDPWAGYMCVSGVLRASSILNLSRTTSPTSPYHGKSWETPCPRVGKPYLEGCEKSPGAPLCQRCCKGIKSWDFEARGQSLWYPHRHHQRCYPNDNMKPLWPSVPTYQKWRQQLLLSLWGGNETEAFGRVSA